MATVPRRGAIYGRQSRTRVGSESLDTQVDACLATATHHGVEVVATLLEPPSTSAYKNRGRSRPRFPELLDLLRAGSIDCVVAYKTDRLSRGGGPGWAPLIEAAEAAGLDLDRFVLIAGAGFMSEFEIGIRATMDREESRKTSERLKDVQARRAAAGEPSGGGARPYGYSRGGTTLVASEAAVIRELVIRFLAGEGTRALARSLNDRAIPTAAGFAWRAETIANMLRSPRIAGLRTHRGEIVGAATWPAIISEADWRAIRGRMLAASHEHLARKYMLSKLLRCGRCGGPLMGKPDRSAAAPDRFRYACLKRPGTTSCGGLTIGPGDEIDRLVGSWIVERLQSPAVYAALTESAVVEDPLDIEKMREIDGRLEELAALYGQGRIGVQEWLAARDPLEASLRTLMSVARSPRRRTAMSTKAPASLDEFMSLPLEDRRDLVRGMTREIRVRPGRRGVARIDLSRVDPIWADTAV